MRQIPREKRILKGVKKLKELKFCVKCGEFKPVSEFYKDRKSSDGLTTGCKACWRPYGHRYYLKNRERLIAKAKSWQKSHQEEIRAYHKNRYEEKNRQGKDFKKF